MRDPLIDRHATAEPKEQDRDNQAPEIELFAVAERMERIGRPYAAPDAQQ